MSIAENGELPEGGNTFTYAEIASNISRVNVGDTVLVGDFTKYDDVVTSLVRAAIAPSAGLVYSSYEAEKAAEAKNLKPVVPVTGNSGLNNQGVPIYRDWVPNLRLPSTVLRPKNHHGKVLNATVSILDATIDGNPGRATERNIDLLLSGDLHVTGKGVRARSMARLIVERSGFQKPRGNYDDLSKSDAAEIMRGLQTESISNARLLEAIRMSKAASYGSGGLGQKRR